MRRSSPSLTCSATRSGLTSSTPSSPTSAPCSTAALPTSSSRITCVCLWPRRQTETDQNLQPDVDILHQIVALPIRIFNDGAVALAQEVWTWIADARPDLESRLMVEVTEAWSRTVRLKQGLFSSAFK